MFEHLKIQPFCFIRQFPSGSVLSKLALYVILIDIQNIINHIIYSNDKKGRR